MLAVRVRIILPYNVMKEKEFCSSLSLCFSFQLVAAVIVVVVKQEKDNMAAELARCTEDLDNTKSQLLKTEKLMEGVKSQLTTAQRMNGLAESYKSVEIRVEELQKEVNLLRAKTHTLEDELQVERRSYQDTLVKCNDFEEQLQRFERLAAENDLRISQAKQESYKKPKYVQILVESYSHLTGLEDQVKSYEEQMKTFEEKVNELNEKLSDAQTEMTNKENLLKQYAEVAEEAVSGWEKAEAEVAALKTYLESSMLLKLTAEDRASLLDGALKECMIHIKEDYEEYEQLKEEKDNMAVELARCTEDLDNTKSQLLETEKLMDEVKSQLTTTISDCLHRLSSGSSSDM